MLKTEEIESRTYQEVIAASSRDQNTLVVLPTGLGKTMIALMVASQKLDKGKTLFLAPTKPLVQQHKREFNKFLDIPEDQLKVMTGDTRPAKREKLWQEKQAFFATPQIVENDIISGKIPFEDFSLVIFDEAHRATGDYAYNFISEKTSCQKLALTASPGGDKEKIMEVADNLEINNFEIRTEDDPDVEPYIEDKEVNWKRVSLDNRFQTANKKMEDAKRTQLKKLQKLDQLDSINNVQKTDLLNLRGKLSSKLSSTDDPKLYSAISHVATALKMSQAIELLQTQGVSQAYDYIRGLDNDDSKAAARALEDEDFLKAKSLIEYLRKKGEEHPKIDKTRELLSDLSGDEKAIVFTEYRATADKILEELEEEGLKPVKFIGQQGDDGMSQTEQIETLSEFDDGEHNVLVSTSIGEEGLDIPAVDKVLFYEPVPSAVRDIQRAGRTGRQEEGEVTVLIAEDTRDEGYYWSAHHKKKNMKKTLKELKNSDEIEEREDDLDQRKLDSYNEEKKEDQAEEKDDGIKVVADDRENSIAKELSRSDIEVEKKRLDVADFIVSDRTGVERKEAADFVDSIIDNRLFDQLQEITQFENPIVIIEGKNLYHHRDIAPEAIRGAISSMALDYGVPIIWTQDEDDTAETLKSLAKREQKDKDRDVQVRGTKSGMTPEETMEFIVSGIPDVNTKIAERLLEEFGTVRKVFTASSGELQEVDGIGQKTADKITDYATRNYE
ncbi:DEAD/DEAH box helicase [Candidatus Nanohalobium constans]|uniref:ERCC4-related helicase n=1 Tax=Candidatus Nanohalobium constans TaxID=2565781 RepID=A0A5Q0UG33_9ARCH|nr:DEAD/DEAH box helicase [Candidatus Nanohalobium constans]QGA80556.1 ERCC4-related helicase [Candidatus Nanohalobium constans]